MDIQPAKGKALTKIGLLYGQKRRWFGLEPDFLFRKRLWKLLKYSCNTL
jgi:hypothetical protein